MMTRICCLVRVNLHLLEALIRVFVVFPFVGEANQRRQLQRWSVKAISIFSGSVALKREATPPERACLLVSNHVSWLDVFVIWSHFDVTFVAKSEVANWPMIGMLARRLGVIFISRGRRGDVVNVGRVIAESLRGGRSVCIFPEGTTTDGTSVAPFRPALFQPALDAASPIQPICLRYQSESGSRAAAVSFLGDTTLVQSLWRLAAGGRFRAHITKLPSIDGKGFDRRAIASQCEIAIANALTCPGSFAMPCNNTAIEVEAGSEHALMGTHNCSV
ncbi:MAG: 1-acyl-sn-glycerol-3-phosphate acyltransferase [Proteobacteria bacterium]|nr:1-acyl-sn-glycerol-3-phosphate acyltransferase [Pseudomonadota bacterium]